MSRERRKVSVAIAGNPNSGKTTIFNFLTGSDQKVGNWPGVTVERKEGYFHGQQLDCRLIDLPGIYSLSADSEDEMVSRRYLAGAQYDLVINVIDASDLERNLYLTMQLREMEIPTLIVVNKLDVARKRGVVIDLKELERSLRVPVIGISAVDQRDLNYLAQEIEGLLAERDPSEHSFMIAYASPIETFISQLPLKEHLEGPLKHMGRRSVALALLEDDHVVLPMALEQGLSKQKLDALREEVVTALEDDLDLVIARSRYKTIEIIKKQAVSESSSAKRRSMADNVVMHHFWGIPIFFAIMFGVFTVTMTVGGAFIDFFDIIFGAVFVDGFTVLLNWIGAPDWVIMILADGFGAGIQTISTFIPIIFFMFLMLGILEDSGYMARAAYVMDRFMRLVGLPGKAFVPMLVGFGCTVPAIMATRTLDSRRDRFLTIFMTPLMSCGARLPVYALFAAAFFGQRAGLIVFTIYAAGILLAMLTGVIMKRTLFKGTFSPFIMELPAYNLPQVGKVTKYAWDRLNIFMYRAGKIILIVVVILSVLGSVGMDGSFGNETNENSILAGIGKAITPVFGPMGIDSDNWPATVGLFTGIFAKEAVVGTLNTLYLADVQSTGQETFSLLASVGEAFTVLGENLADLVTGLLDPFGFSIVSGDTESVAVAVETDTAIFTALRDAFTPASAYAYMLFVLIYAPCVAALGAAFRELGTGYGLVLTGYLTVLAWIIAVLAYQVSEGHSLLWMGIAAGTAVLIYGSLSLLGRREHKIEASSFL
jgi:ferrous iron transport protein B